MFDNSFKKSVLFGLEYHSFVSEQEESTPEKSLYSDNKYIIITKKTSMEAIIIETSP